MLVLPYNLILNTDSYKASHYLQYPPEVEYLSCYIESRGGRFSQIVFFGLQAFIKQYLLQPITAQTIEQAGGVLKAHGLPFNKGGWQYILEKHGGYLPLSIEAVKEGTVVPVSQVLVQVKNTDPRCAWLATYIETALLRAVWYPSTVATFSFFIKKMLKESLLKTQGTLEGLELKLHDFGSRGTSSYESAGLGSLAHLLSFSGTDTLHALSFAKNYYDEPCAGFSIPAAEHSTIISWGREREEQAYQHIIEQFKDYPLVSLVSDSYDLFHAVKKIFGTSLNKFISNSKTIIVLRPDSGEVVSIVKRLLEELGQYFGYSVNTKGYKVLPSFIRVIQGDGMSYLTIQAVIKMLESEGWSLQNLTFGMGGELLQNVHRDVQRFAMKISSVFSQGRWLDVSKTPQTDQQKNSKKGRLALVRDSVGTFHTIPLAQLSSVEENYLQEVYANGRLLRTQNLLQIREEVAKNL